jgi:hypothetical protein
MSLKINTLPFFSIPLFVAIAMMFPTQAFSQMMVKGKVTEEDTDPIPYASVKLMHHTSGIVTDTAGNFKLTVPSSKQNDTIIISSVGYESLKIPVRSAIKKQAFILKTSAAKMDAVIIKSFGKESIAGAQSEIVGYFRSWNTGKTGGEIGRSIYVGHKEYLVSKVRFKIYSNCDTCVIRLHIREFKNGQPGADLLLENIEQTILKANVADKAYEFDLSKYNIQLSKENIFVSFEVMGGSNANYSDCSIAFVGSEPGVYIYKSRYYDDWSFTEDYAIFMKVFFKYND